MTDDITGDALNYLHHCLRLGLMLDFVCNAISFAITIGAGCWRNLLLINDQILHITNGRLSIIVLYVSHISDGKILKSKSNLIEKLTVDVSNLESNNILNAAAPNVKKTLMVNMRFNNAQPP